MTKTIAMAVLASEQLMPNIEGLLFFHSKSRPVEELFIYCSNDESKSKGPAKRIGNLAKLFLPDLRVTIHHPDDTEKGTAPDKVYQAIFNWFEGLDTDTLIVNATGGLKTMFAGVLPFVMNNKARVIYRELNGDWLELKLDSSGGFSTHNITVDKNKINERYKKLKILELAKAQSGFDNMSLGKPATVDCVAGLKEVILHGWNWKKLSSTEGGFSGGGIAFEHWFASLIGTFSADDIGVSLQLMSDKETRMETDIWVLKNARLYFFDLKLISKTQNESLATQIASASQQAAQFGGMGVKTILIRPGYEYNPQEESDWKELAGRFGCDIWFQQDMCQILTKLEALFGNASSDKKALSKLLESACEGLGYCFSNPSFGRSIMSRDGDRVLALSALMQYLEAESEHARWTGVSFGADQQKYLAFQICQQDREQLLPWRAKLIATGCQTQIVGNNQLLIGPLDKKMRAAFNRLFQQTSDHPLLEI